MHRIKKKYDKIRTLSLVWFFLRNYPVRFLRQKIIENYIVDFYCSKANFVIEIDGSQHYQDENIISDKY